MELKGKKVLVFGAGKSGIGAADLLNAVGACPVLYDGKADLDKESVLHKISGNYELPIYAGELPKEVQESLDLVVLSPGVPTDLPIVKGFYDQGLPVWGEVELAYQTGKGEVLAITGTNGKTTTTYLIKSILEHLGKKVGLIGTNQNMIGDMIMETSRTTPDSLELMQLFDMIASHNVDYVVMEVSSHALALDRVTACTFDVGAFTNITQDHLDFHKTMEEYLAAKSILFNICNI